MKLRDRFLFLNSVDEPLQRRNPSLFTISTNKAKH